jgi:hypothetical protein
MNLTGYTFYSLYCAYGYLYDGSEPETGKVDLNDLIVNLHALLLSFLLTIQAFVYPLGKNRIQYWTISLLIALWLFVMVYGTLTIV